MASKLIRVGLSALFAAGCGGTSERAGAPRQGGSAGDSAVMAGGQGGTGGGGDHAAGGSGAAGGAMGISGANATGGSTAMGGTSNGGRQGEGGALGEAGSAGDIVGGSAGKGSGGVAGKGRGGSAGKGSGGVAASSGLTSSGGSANVGNAGRSIGGATGRGGRGGGDAAGRDGASGAAGGGTKVCGGLTGQTCDPGEVCHWPNGSCGAGDQTGQCLLFGGGFCVGAVCGCDDHAYVTACRAYAAGVDITGTEACVPGDGAAGDNCFVDADCTGGLLCCSSPVGLNTCTMVQGGQCPLTP